LETVFTANLLTVNSRFFTGQMTQPTVP